MQANEFRFIPDGILVGDQPIRKVVETFREINEGNTEERDNSLLVPVVY